MQPAVIATRPDTSVQPDGEVVHPLSNIFENASVHQGGLDQWTLGHLPVHERMMEGEQTLGMPKASHALIHSGKPRRERIPSGFAGKCSHFGGAGVTALAHLRTAESIQASM